MANSKRFLEDHRYDPFEIYAEEFRDELEVVPDPKTEPFAIYEEFLYILRTMGMFKILNTKRCIDCDFIFKVHGVLIGQLSLS